MGSTQRSECTTSPSAQRKREVEHLVRRYDPKRGWKLVQSATVLDDGRPLDPEDVREGHIQSLHAPSSFEDLETQGPGGEANADFIGRGAATYSAATWPSKTVKERALRRRNLQGHNPAVFVLVDEPTQALQQLITTHVRPSLETWLSPPPDRDRRTSLDTLHHHQSTPIGLLQDSEQARIGLLFGGQSNAEGLRRGAMDQPKRDRARSPNRTTPESSQERPHSDQRERHGDHQNRGQKHQLEEHEPAEALLLLVIDLDMQGALCVGSLPPLF